MNRSFRILLVVILIGIFHLDLASQSQVWNEYMLNMPLAKKHNLELAGTYSTVIGQPKWRSFDVQATPEFSLSKHVDVMGAVLLSSTFQSESLSTFEIREMIGARFYFTPDFRLQTRMLIRLEQRNLQDKTTGDWDHSHRGRARAELLFPINAKSMSHDKLWYAISDLETFIMLDQDVHERFANRLRFRIGAGYRINYRFRAEFIYMLQRSRNTIDNGFESVDNIFRLRFKHYIQRK